MFDIQTVKVGNKAKQPNKKLTNGKKVFLGWLIERNGGSLVDFDKKIIEDVTYYARWFNMKLF